MKKWVIRSVAVMAAVFVLVGSCPWALAATPQEGWFIAGTETLDGIQYYVIDNKVNMNPWLVDIYSQRIQLDFSFVDWIGGSNSLSGYFDEILLSQMYYKGWSDYSWRVDEDWVAKLWVDESSVTDVPIQIYMYDRTQLPTVQYQNMSEDDNVLSSEQFESEWTISQNVDACIPFNDLASTGAFFDQSNAGQWTYWQVGNFQMASVYSVPTRLCGTDINDLCMTAAYGYSESDQAFSEADSLDLVHARVAVQWLCPVDKAPAGMAVGDSWPKVRPIEVEMEEAFDQWREVLAQRGLINSPDEIGSQYNEYNLQASNGILATNLDQEQYSLLSAVLGGFNPLLGTLLPVAAVGVVLIILANKGMS